MKTRILSLGLIFIMIISLAGCSGDTEEVETTGDVAETEETTGDVVETEESTVISDPEEETDEEATQESEITFRHAKTYSEGLAWINFNHDGCNYWGVINRSGELIFALAAVNDIYDDEFINGVTDFSNGYAYIWRGVSGLTVVRYEIINTEGEVVAAYYKDDYDDICYGGGYFMTEEYSADFYSTSYVYTIYSPEGDVVWTYESETECSMSYDEDSGVFSCGDESYAAEVNDYSEYSGSSDPARRIKISEGADGNNYLILYDSSGNQVSEPILSYFSSDYKDSHCVYSCSRLVMNVWEKNAIPPTVLDVYIYDEDGNYIYALSEKGYTGMSIYEEGVALVTNYENDEGINCSEVYYGGYCLTIADGEEPVYLDLNGDPLFDSIDMSAFYELYE